MSEPTSTVNPEPWEWFSVLIRVVWHEAMYQVNGRVLAQSQGQAEWLAVWLCFVMVTGEQKVQVEGADLWCQIEHGALR